MPKPRKTWRQKLEEEHPEHGKIVDVPPKMQNRFGTGKMLIPKPLDIDSFGIIYLTQTLVQSA